MVLRRRKVTYRFPDGTRQTLAMPALSRLKVGQNFNHALLYNNHLILVWYRRVKGGWEHFEPGRS